MQQVKKGREVGHLLNSPLNESKEEIILHDAAGNSYNFGGHFHGFGKGAVKGMNLQFRTMVIDGKKMKLIDFKVNHVFRKRLQDLIEGLKGFTPGEMDDILKFTQSHAKGFKMKEVPFELSPETKTVVSKAYQFSFEGLGKVLIGSQGKTPNIYEKVRIIVDENKSLFELHELLAFFNLDDAFRISSQDDIERLKIGQLFRIHCPRQATPFERNDEFFDTSVEELKTKIIQRAPVMKEIFEKDLSNMQTYEILPGELRYGSPDIAKKAYDLGARTLISSIGSCSDEDAYLSFASILKMGLISQEIRYENGMQISGLSMEDDFAKGGADSVYTQLLTEKNFREKMPLSKLAYSGNVRVYISLEALNSGTYQYPSDEFGTRSLQTFSPKPPQYLNRLNIFEFVEKEQIAFDTDNETMFKRRIGPELIIGASVNTKKEFNDLLAVLSKSGLIDQKNGVKTIRGKPVDQFIHVSDRLHSGLIRT